MAMKVTSGRPHGSPVFSEGPSHHWGRLTRQFERIGPCRTTTTTRFASNSVGSLVVSSLVVPRAVEVANVAADVAATRGALVADVAQGPRQHQESGRRKARTIQRKDVGDELEKVRSPHVGRACGENPLALVQQR